VTDNPNEDDSCTTLKGSTAGPNSRRVKSQPGASSKFPKGYSGNPNGRPKGSRNLSTILRAAADANLSATIDGKKRRITQLAANVWRLAQQGAGGDHRAAVKFIDLVAKMEREASDSGPAEFPFGPEDLEVLKAVHERMLLCEAPNEFE
jgi:hypothetical protein